MAKFRTAFEECKDKFDSPVGSQEFPVFQLNEQGELVEVGKTNVYDKIQTYKDDCLLENIIRRCALTGDTLEAPKERFCDTTVFPKDALEAHNLIAKANAFTNSLTKDDFARLMEVGFDAFLSEKLASAAESAKQTKNEEKEVTDNE